jgi:hypothetical protein
MNLAPWFSVLLTFRADSYMSRTICGLFVKRKVFMFGLSRDYLLAGIQTKGLAYATLCN